MRKVVGVVDDDPAMLRSVDRVLRVAGYDTELFSSGEELLGGIAASAATCFVIDIHLGGISGIELRRLLAAVGSVAPVIFVSGAANQQTKVAAIESGCIALLHKPFSAAALVEAVRSGFHSA